MKYFRSLIVLNLAVIFSAASCCKLICYYEISSAAKVGPGKFTSRDMELALHFCSHVVYKYVTITPKTNAVTALTPEREKVLADMSYFKKKFKNVKFLLSLGGENDLQTTKTVLHLLEANRNEKKAFIKSLMNILKRYNFDGLSLDLPLPTEKAENPRTLFEKVWYNFKGLFSKNHLRDSKASVHKEQLNTLILQLSAHLKDQGGLLTLNLMPNVDINKYFNVAEVIEYLDFVVLSAFDFYTPQRNPHEADLMSPTKPTSKLTRRMPTKNFMNLYKLLHSQRVPRYKIVIGVAAFGRSWKMTTSSNSDGIPPVVHTDGPAPAGARTQTPGFLSWPEVCEKLSHDPKLTRVSDDKSKSGVYAFRPADSRGNFGIWISYEDPVTTAAKALYVLNHNLGGVALFDLNLDDIHGECSGEKFPILRSINFKLKKLLS